MQTKQKYITMGGVDMTMNKPCPMQYASCILTRYDNGVSNQQKSRTGVLLKKVRNVNKNE